MITAPVAAEAGDRDSAAIMHNHAIVIALIFS
jgi:hypothetical protein